MRAVALLLNWAHAREIDVEERTSSLTMFSPEEIVDLRDSLRVSSRSKAQGKLKPEPVTVASGTLYSRCHMACAYLRWLALRAIQRIRPDDPKHLGARGSLERFEKAMVANLPKQRSAPREGLDEKARTLFLEVIRPEDPRNPFKKEHRHRNYALLLLYYETGIRRGEALKLKGEHLVLHGDEPSVAIVRDADDPGDPRRSEPRVKTLPHIDPISPGLAAALRDWVMTHRKDERRYPNARRTAYVFVARTGKPLALRTVNEMFELLTKSFQEFEAGVYPHILRHTANDMFSEAVDRVNSDRGHQRIDEAKETQARNYKFGWKKTSKQGERYQERHTRREAAEVMGRVHEASMQGRNK